MVTCEKLTEVFLPNTIFPNSFYDKNIKEQICYMINKFYIK